MPVSGAAAASEAPASAARRRVRAAAHNRQRQAGRSKPTGLAPGPWAAVAGWLAKSLAVWLTIIAAAGWLCLSPVHPPIPTQPTLCHPCQTRLAA